MAPEQKQPVIEAAHIGETLGFEQVSIDPEQGTLRARYNGRQAFTNGRHIVQGGMQAAMLDNAMAIAAMNHLGPGWHISSLEIKVSYIAPAPLGPLLVDAKIVKKGRKIMFLEANLMDEQENVLAIASSTAKIIAPRD